MEKGQQVKQCSSRSTGGVAPKACKDWLSADEVARWIREASKNVETASTTSGVTSEALSKLGEEADCDTGQAEALQAQMRETAKAWQDEKDMVQESLEMHLKGLPSQKKTEELRSARRKAESRVLYESIKHIFAV